MTANLHKIDHIVVLMLVAGYEALTRIRQDQSIEQRIRDLGALIKEEGEIFKLRMVSDGIGFIRKRLEVVA